MEDTAKREVEKYRSVMIFGLPEDYIQSREEVKNKRNRIRKLLAALDTRDAVYDIEKAKKIGKYRWDKREGPGKIIFKIE